MVAIAQARHGRGIASRSGDWKKFARGWRAVRG